MRTPSRRCTRARALAAVLAAALVCVVPAAAGVNAYTVRMTPADQAAARAVMLRQSDVGDPALWESGAEVANVKATVRAATSIRSISDLVVTGAAAMRFRQPGLVMHSVSEVFGSAEDGRRSAGSGRRARRITCVRGLLLEAVADAGRALHLASGAWWCRRSATHSAGFRTLVDVTTADGHVRVAYRHGARRPAAGPEVSLTTIMPLTSVPTLWSHELVLARRLIGRARV